VLIKEMRSLGLDVELISSVEEEELGDMAEIPTTITFMDALAEDEEISIDTALEEIASSLLSMDLDFDLSDAVPSLVDLDEDGDLVSSGMNGSANGARTNGALASVVSNGSSSSISATFDDSDSETAFALIDDAEEE
jgi:hypothetical protein